jgi:hypothetical protein
MTTDGSTDPLLDLELEILLLRDLFDEHISYFSAEDAWLTFEKIAKICGFVHVVGKNAPEIVEAASNEASEVALEIMRGWSEGVSPADGWPEVLLRRLERRSK